MESVPGNIDDFWALWEPELDDLWGNSFDLDDLFIVRTESSATNPFVEIQPAMEVEGTVVPTTEAPRHVLPGMLVARGTKRQLETDPLLEEGTAQGKKRRQEREEAEIGRGTKRALTVTPVFIPEETLRERKRFAHQRGDQGSSSPSSESAFGDSGSQSRSRESTPFQESPGSPSRSREGTPARGDLVQLEELSPHEWMQFFVTMVLDGATAADFVPYNRQFKPLMENDAIWKFMCARDYWETMGRDVIFGWNPATWELLPRVKRYLDNASDKAHKNRAYFKRYYELRTRMKRDADFHLKSIGWQEGAPTELQTRLPANNVDLPSNKESITSVSGAIDEVTPLLFEETDQFDFWLPVFDSCAIFNEPEKKSSYMYYVDPGALTIPIKNLEGKRGARRQLWKLLKKVPSNGMVDGILLAAPPVQDRDGLAGTVLAEWEQGAIMEIGSNGDTYGDAGALVHIEPKKLRVWNMTENGDISRFEYEPDLLYDKWIAVRRQSRPGELDVYPEGLVFNPGVVRLGGCCMVIEVISDTDDPLALNARALSGKIDGERLAGSAWKERCYWITQRPFDADQGILYFVPRAYELQQIGPDAYAFQHSKLLMAIFFPSEYVDGGLEMAEGAYLRHRAAFATALETGVGSKESEFFQTIIDTCPDVGQIVDFGVHGLYPYHHKVFRGPQVLRDSWRRYPTLFHMLVSETVESLETKVSPGGRVRRKRTVSTRPLLYMAYPMAIAERREGFSIPFVSRFIREKLVQAARGDKRNGVMTLKLVSDPINNRAQCDVCQTKDATHACSVCRGALYCSVGCQQDHWKQGHHRSCKKPHWADNVVQ